jgi:hypothetical protein
MRVGWNIKQLDSSGHFYLATGLSRYRYTFKSGLIQKKYHYLSSYNYQRRRIIRSKELDISDRE